MAKWRVWGNDATDLQAMIVQKGAFSITQTGKVDDDRNSRMLDTDRVWAGNCPWACFIRFDLSIE